MANIRIFIDPGHGGSDSGAVSGKRKESNDVLKLSLAIGEKLVKDYPNNKFTVSLTGSGALSVIII